MVGCFYSCSNFSLYYQKSLLLRLSRGLFIIFGIIYYALAVILLWHPHSAIAF
ncbi:hypothetical protein [Nostoc sp. C117]|uniref:hypothetical protein n=1 Tax=Nostoc sp. C117 TaxID=3349875 RepID=UPI00370D7665